MQYELHHAQGVEAGAHIIKHDTGPFGESFELAHRWRLEDIEPTKKYKAQQEAFPRHRDRQKGDELPGHFVDHNFLRIFEASGPGVPGSRRNPDGHRQDGECGNGQGLKGRLDEQR